MWLPRASVLTYYCLCDWRENRSFSTPNWSDEPMEGSNTAWLTPSNVARELCHETTEDGVDSFQIKGEDIFVNK